MQSGAVTPLTKMIKSVKIAASMSTDDGGRTARERAQKKVKHLSLREVRSLFSAIPAVKLRDRVLFHLIYRYGLRRSEARRIQLADFDFEGGILDVRRLKGGDSHPYPLFPDTKQLVIAYLENRSGLWTSYLFPSRQRLGEPISASLIAHLFRQYAKAANLPPDRRHVHVLRHSIGMHMQEGELDGLDMKDWMGHRNWASTEVYIQVSNRRRRKSMQKMLESGEIA